MISKMLIMNTPLEQRFSPLVSSCKTGSGVKALSMKKIISLFIGFLVGTVALPFLVLILEFSFLKIKGREERFQQVSAPEGQKQESKNEKKSPIREELELKLEIIEHSLNSSESKQDIIDQMSNLLMVLTQIQALNQN